MKRICLVLACSLLCSTAYGETSTPAQPVSKAQKLANNYMDCIKDPKNNHWDPVKKSITDAVVGDMAACDKQAMELKKEIGPKGLLSGQINIFLQIMQNIKNATTPKGEEKL